MQSITFITGNQQKAEYLEKFLGFPIEHMKLELDEIQSLNLREVVEHKAHQAYIKTWKPVLVEDTSLEFEALGRLPGTFIKFFVEEMPILDICSLVNGKSRKALARCGYGYYDENGFVYFENSLAGKITEAPRWSRGFGWDQIFIPDMYTTTSAELNSKEYEIYYKKVKPLDQVREFLINH